MDQRTTKCLAFVFFWSVGWICTASVVEASDGLQPSEQVAVSEPEMANVDEIVGDAGDEALEGQTVAADSLGLIDLHVKDLDITMVLQLLSLEAKRNIIATRNVSGRVSADLYEVDFYDALDAILHANGYGYEERNNFIYVYTAEEMEQRRQAQQKPVVRVHRLNYITANEAARFVSPLLSASGTITVSGEAVAGMQPTVSDAGANSNAQGETLVVRDFAENVEEIMAIIHELDVRPKQVQVAATILEAALNENNAFGVDINAVVDFDFANFGTPLGAVDDLLSGAGPGPGESGQAVQTTVGQTGSGPSGIKVGILSSNVQAFINALDSVTDTTVLANPTLLALNRQRAELLVGRRLGYLSTTQTETAATQTIEFLDVGTQLTFRAFISDDDFVRLELRPSLSDGTTENVGGMVIPEETTSELVTNVMVRSGQTVVLGGLFIESTQVARRQVPWLGDVPLLGAGFRGQDDTHQRSEVIFLVTPTVVKDEAMYAQADRAAESAELARMGARQGLLPWSRTKQTASYMRKAVEHRREGRDDKALWNVNMALTLDPTFVEALRLKSELTGERLYVPERSLMHDSINHMVDEQVRQRENARQEGDEGAQADNIDKKTLEKFDAVFEDDLSDDAKDDADKAADAKKDAAASDTGSDRLDVFNVLNSQRNGGDGQSASVNTDKQ